MLFAVEGGGFFSSSASGYSKGLALLLLGKRKKDKPMRVLPWNQYHLMDQEADVDLQLANRNGLSRRCASFVCFGSSSGGLDAPSLGSAQKDIQLDTPGNQRDKDHSTCRCNDDSARKAALRSSLKKLSKSNSVSGKQTKGYEASGENVGEFPGQTERRKVQWTDACGRELVEIKEFEPSEKGESDEESDGESGKKCSCMIM